MDKEPEIEFEITPHPAALKRLGLEEDEAIELVAAGLEAYLRELSTSESDAAPDFRDYIVRVGKQPLRLGDIADIAIATDPAPDDDE